MPLLATAAGVYMLTAVFSFILTSIERLVSMDFPVIAVRAHWNAPAERFQWIADHGFALEYSPDPQALHTLARHVDPWLEHQIPVRYHAFFPQYPLGHTNSEIAEQALNAHIELLETIEGRGEQVITIHIGLDRSAPLDTVRVVKHLTRLVKAASDRGVIICLENLRSGLTSNPKTVVDWASKSSALITLDIGHAASCAQVTEGSLTVLDFAQSFADRLYEVHMYGREEDRHYPPQDMVTLGPVVDYLLETRCSWWTIELDDYDEILATKALLQNYLESKGGEAP
jgi:sugar phosphate isomerase/epimerase